MGRLAKGFIRSFASGAESWPDDLGNRERSDCGKLGNRLAHRLSSHRLVSISAVFNRISHLLTGNLPNPVVIRRRVGSPARVPR